MMDVDQDGLSQEQIGRLEAAHVLIAGGGAIAEACARSLIASSVGSIQLACNDLARLSLLRQKLADENHAEASPNSLNGRTCLTFQLVESFDMAQAEALIKGNLLVIDLLDDWQSKLLVSDLCMALRRPLLHCAVAAMRVQLFMMQPAKSCCLRCLLAALGIEDTIMEAGVQAAFPAFNGLVGNALALAAVKLISGFGASQSNELIKLDCLSGELEVLRGFDPVADCPDCGTIRRAGNR
jgi:molybdopterin/thiamine biosynthesis adenylyltransferase